jgi:type I restriction enzyme S subunit
MSVDETWPTARLGDYASIKARIGWKGLQASEYRDGGYIFLATPNIKGPQIDFRNVNFISERRYVESPELMLAEGDVLLVKDGSTLGISNLVRKIPGPATVNGSIAVLRCSDKLVPAFLHQLTKAYKFQKLISDKKSGLGVPHLFQADLREFEIPIPFNWEQLRIAEILDTLDTAIHETEAIIAKLKAIKQGLLHDLLTRGIDANGELRPPQSEALHLYKQSPLGWIPKEWECVRLSEKLGVFGGKRLPAGHAYAEHPTVFKYLRVKDFFERDYSLEELENLHERTFKALERYEIRSGQLFISIAGSLGYVGVHRADSNEGVRTILTENAARIVPSYALVPEFVAAYMNSNMVQCQVTAEKGTGGGVPKLALFRIEQFSLAWPENGEQLLIAERLRGIGKRISDEALLLRKLMLEKAGLMDDLLTGRVRVTPLLESSGS